MNCRQERSEPVDVRKCFAREDAVQLTRWMSTPASVGTKSGPPESALAGVCVAGATDAGVEALFVGGRERAAAGVPRLALGVVESDELTIS
jgi:hypothetical protein